MLFISYRRDDSGGHVGRLYDAMSLRFGAARLFFDIDHIAPGQDFFKVIEDAVTRCAVMLVVIGKRWAGPGKRGARRIDDPGDFVHLEVAAGLRREGLLVIPVLVAGGQMPGPAELPDDLKDLSRRNAFDLSDLRWKDDVARLIAQLDGAMRVSRTPLLSPLGPVRAIVPLVSSRLWIRWGAAAAVGIALLGIGIAKARSAHRAPTMQTAPAVIPADLTMPSGATPVVPSLGQAARDVLSHARDQWRGDAILAGITVQLTNGGSGSDAYRVNFSCRSPTDGAGLTVVTEGSGTPQYQNLPPASAASAHALPDAFVDLPDAITTARTGGMLGQVRMAVLTPGTSTIHATWTLKSTADASHLFTIDAVTGQLLRHPTSLAAESAGSSSGRRSNPIGGLFSKVKGAIHK
jgi:hypothetical protein